MPTPGRSRTPAWSGAGLVSLALPLVLALTGCSPADAQTQSDGGSRGAKPAATTSVSGPEVTTNLRDTMPFASKIVVSAPSGKLGSVTVTSAHGSVQGTLDDAGTRWVSTAERAPGITYRLLATATNDEGGTTTLDRSFTTGPAPRTLTADVSPFGGQKVGVGQPIIVKLSSPVTGGAARRDVERALVVSADKDYGLASWHWTSSKELHFRPKDFWPARTKVTVAVNFVGVRAGKGLWGAKNRTVNFAIGRAFVMNINDDKHMMTVTVDGKAVRKVPVSMGRSGYETRSGIKTIMSHERRVRMTSESYGGADFYDEIVYYAQRLTWSGEYIHSAPWSVGVQGRRNVSHGCVNISPKNAVWLFKKTLIGDPVITTGTNRRMEQGNGTGGDWNVSWAAWVKGSALS